MSGGLSYAKRLASARAQVAILCASSRRRFGKVPLLWPRQRHSKFYGLSRMNSRECGLLETDFLPILLV